MTNEQQTEAIKFADWIQPLADRIKPETERAAKSVFDILTCPVAEMRTDEDFVTRIPCERCDDTALMGALIALAEQEYIDPETEDVADLARDLYVRAELAVDVEWAKLSDRMSDAKIAKSFDDFWLGAAKAAANIRGYKRRDAEVEQIRDRMTSICARQDGISFREQRAREDAADRAAGVQPVGNRMTPSAATSKRTEDWVRDRAGQAAVDELTSAPDEVARAAVQQLAQAHAKSIVAAASGAVSEAELADAWTRATERQPEPSARVETVLPANGTVLLSAQAKAGKTTLIANLAWALQTGGRFMGRFAAERVAGAVTILQADMSAVEMDRWLTERGVVLGDRVNVLGLRGETAAIDILNDAARATMIEQLRARNTEVLVLDTVAKFLSASGLDENSNTDVNRWFAMVEEVKAQAGIGSVVLCHHAGWEASGRERGASAFAGAVDVRWFLTKTGQEQAATRFFETSGRMLEPVTKSELEFEQRSRALSINVGVGPRKVSADERDTVTQERVFNVLRASSEPMSVTAISKGDDSGQGINKTAVGKALTDLKTAGRVVISQGPRGVVYSAVRGAEYNGSTPPGFDAPVQPVQDH